MTSFHPNPILVPIDYSVPSLQAARLARTLTDDGNITLVYVGLDFDLVVPAYGWASDDPGNTQANHLERLTTWRNENGLGDLNVRVEFGDPGTEVCTVAEELKSQLIVLPSHGRHGLKRILMGSVAERIVRHCDCSVLVLRRSADDSPAPTDAPAEWLPRQKVVVPIDFSESSRYAIDSALQTVEAQEDVEVLNVIYELDDPVLIGSQVVTDDTRRAGRQEHLENWLKEHGYGSVKGHAVTGDPGIMIVDFAERNQADLIVMPSHGYHGLHRLVLGSTTERVLRYASQPVLVLRRHDAE